MWGEILLLLMWLGCFVPGIFLWRKQDRENAQRQKEAAGETPREVPGIGMVHLVEVFKSGQQIGVVGDQPIFDKLIVRLTYSPPGQARSIRQLPQTRDIDVEFFGVDKVTRSKEPLRMLWEDQGMTMIMGEVVYSNRQDTSSDLIKIAKSVRA